MFAPDATVRSAVSSLRNPRRRQRTNSDDSVKLPKAKRQRSALGEDTFEPHPFTASEQESSVDADPNAYKAGFVVQKDLALRGPKRPEKRSDADGIVILSKTDHYTVSQLPSLPDQLRVADSVPPGSFFTVEQGYALVLTPSHAIIWPYAVPSSSPSPSDIFTLTIPESSGSPAGATPCGVLIPNATVAPPGLLVVIPGTGKIIYWETVSNAVVLGLVRQKQNGIQTSISGMLPGEYAKEIINAEPSGVIVTFSSGRVAHVTLRDPQGKAALTVNFLRSTSKLGGSGFLGGIKSVLTGGLWKRDIAAARPAKSSQRGQRDIVIATSTGIFEIWDTHWNNGSTMKAEVDLRRTICEATTNTLDAGFENGLKILDFVCAPKQDGLDHVPNPDTDPSVSVFALVVHAQQHEVPTLAVLKIDISGNDGRVVSAHHVEPRNIPPHFGKSKAKLHIPKLGDTAFIVLERSVIVLSLIPVRESPSSQLLMESRHMSGYFQDCIQLRADKQEEVLGTSVEEQSDNRVYPACLVMLRGFGIIRIAASPHTGSDNVLEKVQMTAKDKLEQAIFYGAMSENPLDFLSENWLNFPAEELEEAALDICDELLRSTSRFISAAAVSIEQHLSVRAKALDDLVFHLIRHGVPLSRLTRWHLLWAAEKLASQRALWKVEERFRKSKNGKPTYLNRVVELMNEKFKTRSEVASDRNDSVRHWFIYDTFRMEHIIPWLFNAIRDHKGGASKQGQQFADQVLEASELSLAALETAFRFREEHFGAYGLGEESLEDGILLSGYEDLPEFWTSHGMGYIETSHLLDLELDSCRSWLQRQVSRGEPTDPMTVEKVAHNSFRQLRVFGKMHRERVRWLSAQSDPKLVDESKNIENNHIRQRKWQLFKLAGIGQLKEAMSLAEEFQDMSALVELIVELQDQAKADNLRKGESSDETRNEGLEQCKRKITEYFERFGGHWADAFFSRQISVGQPGMLLAMSEYRPYVTRFLRKVPAYRRLSWINDVTGETDYDTASSSLEKLALEDESDVWSQRAELSIAKLCRLAAWEKSANFDHSVAREEIRRFDARAEINTIQELVYDHISPALHGAIDQKAEIELAVEHFGGYLEKDRPAFHEVLEVTLAKVVAREVLNVDQLIDLLTLMDDVQFLEGEHDELSGREFYFALHALQLSGYAKTDPELYDFLQKLIWRRCMIRDNWEALGNTGQKLDKEVEAEVSNTALFRTLTECLAEERLGRPNNEPICGLHSPSEILKWTPDPAIVKTRFHPDQGTRILRDLSVEAELLRQYVEKGKLELWFSELLASAKSEVSKSTIEEDTGSNHDPSITPSTSEKRAKLNWL
ncbi:hypothetical protein DTO166G4_621 [Paecilomyces variotii]|uniref:Non-repetitive/WGA-negative nucleoporin C-terminal-domain-containing protein n=1 Tax=Byssochlamys spectabilis TaxID=264951 RepID=A0A443HZI7_BYSSP|nr:Non-repetitive/WGA-negative nucleoporin C-terminal-domain-containing protein [Paecilomyces variotii]KAJ9196783.1 hypothetical protein DTO164E3_6032 [Paecilomyces variotii]KAJ9217817.1 hypothetical protein DTO166G4_621 [Paecilomyces variotii]KAJ9238915.1 hypothetical protein DTO166G5_2711 [Paecilomyces variotii]KAJ9243841.1 hypothetical protein DTO169E5_2470 [Paecilomyces variotii]KAJ9260674.1 hypothetical protein DTO195F2_4514 [Paecilomyces variotii]